MSEVQKATITKLPTKTKIACWYMLGYAIVETIITIWFLFHFPAWSDEAEWSFGAYLLALVFIFTGFLYCLPSLIIIIGGRRAWAGAITIMIINVIILILTAFIFLCLYVFLFGHYSDRIILLIPIWIAGVVPLILVKLDQKNYFEMLRQREALK